MKKEKQTKNQNKGSFLGRKANLWITLCLIICMIVFFQKPQICYAASAQVNITGDVDECKVGDEIYVYIQVETDIPLGDFEANLTYDDSILEYKTGSPAISGGSGYLKISDMNIADDTYSKKYVVMFQVLEAGTVKVKLGEKAKVFDAENGNEMSVSSSGFTLTSTSVETASVNSDLESLRINPSTIEPEFSKDVYKYNATVPHDTEQLFISAIPADEKATVSIVGNEALQDGDNKIDIVVKAENGGTSTYTIRCYREIESQNKEDEENPDTSNEEQVKNSMSVIVEGENTYLQFSGGILLSEKPAEVEVPRGFQSSSMILSGVSVPVYTLTGDATYEYMLFYGSYQDGEPCFYQYDRVEETIQRYAGDGVIIADLSEDTENVDQIASTKYQKNFKIAVVVIVILIIIIIGLAVFLVRILLNQQENKEKKINS